MHYRRWQSSGDPLRVAGRWDGHVKVDKTCLVDDCEKRSGKASYCPKHARRKRLYGDPTFFPERRASHRHTPETFWASVDVQGPDECWEWSRRRTAAGYGRVSYQGMRTAAHRVALMLSTGELPEALQACHHCDNPPCCNPRHLYWGTRAQNTLDMYARGRGNRPTGTAHHMVHYTDADADLIRAAYAKILADKEARGLTRPARGAVMALAVEFGLSRDTVRRIGTRTPSSSEGCDL